MHVECGRAIFGRHLKFSMIRCRKCNFVLIYVEVGVLLTFLASMKAKVRLYQKYVSVFGCLHMKKMDTFMRFFKYLFQTIHLGYRIQKLSDSLGICIEFHRIHVSEHPIR